MTLAVPAAESAFVDELLESLRTNPPASKDRLQERKVRLARSHGLRGIPSDARVLALLPESERPQFEDLLRIKPARTASGVAVVTVMTAPHACPHGVCVYCPGGPRFHTPQSYTGTEPAAKRAAEHRYDPFAQTQARLRALREIGHRTDKVDLIVLGGTFTSLEEGYKEWFVKGCLDGMNGIVSPSLEEAQTANETADARCIGLTIETKPDWFLGPEVEHALSLGTTRVELGLQSTHDDILARVHRGHTDAQSREALLRAKAAGLKVGVHMMPGLPGSDPGRDLESFRGLFEDPAYRPDFLKIYPTLVLAGTALHGMWEHGLYRPLSLEEAVELVARVKALVPRWCRIQRVQREIGAPHIEGGPTKGDLRVLARERLRAEGKACRCVRCREVGFRGVEPRPEAITRLREDYESSGGHEVFLSLEDPAAEVLVAYLRLRIDATGGTVRELKVFGQLVPLREPPGPRWQHRGMGRQLMEEAESLARDEFHVQRMRVTAGVGVRGYYRSRGYRLERPYMVREL
ncbi:MAG TPA: tRNA uridine(34) 5-carboxymethylaminomethyl modification radical SAM/GNAT enzyme Elp3 [Thermoplasmata archaeon]|nr:tRNA uridine(34) 5-carboxymethylaminomethyl modification radical SAM/GNAT enzyme Elp3 [Thermoplasmata archaeon]